MSQHKMPHRSIEHWPESLTKTLLEAGLASKETAFFRSIARKAGSLNSGKVTRDHKPRRQTQGLHGRKQPNL